MGSKMTVIGKPQAVDEFTGNDERVAGTVQPTAEIQAVKRDCLSIWLMK
jgi:hypothetical protein